MIKLILLITLLSSAAFARNQLEEIFVWKVSDELKLSIDQEKKFSEIMKKIGDKKLRFNSEVTDALAQMGDKAKAPAALKKYRQSLEQLQKLNLEEFDEVRKLFGEEKTAQYFKIKSDVTSKIKALLVNEKDTGKVKKILPPPKVIEEK